MANDNRKTGEGGPSSCGRNERCRSGQWTWIALAIVVALVSAARQVKCGESNAAKEIAQPVEEWKSIVGTNKETAVKGKTLPRLVDLGAGKCIPCKMMAPILEDLKKTHADKFEVQFLDVRQDPDEVKKFNIRVIPTQIFIAPDGRELFRHEGFLGKDDILAKWKELGFISEGNIQ